MSTDAPAPTLIEWPTATSTAEYDARPSVTDWPKATPTAEYEGRHRTPDSEPRAYQPYNYQPEHLREDCDEF